MADQPNARPSVALLGTGIMGAAMGRNMLRAGLPLRAWNRTIVKARTLEPDGAQVAQTPAEAVAGRQIIVTMLADADAVADAITAAAPGLHEGQIWAQVSTVGVTGADALARLAGQHGLVFVDAPVLGTRQPAEQGTLTVFASGPDAARAAVQPVFEAIGEQDRVARPGAGHRIQAQGGGQQLGARRRGRSGRGRRPGARARH